jgi:predicted nucleic acid-binding protein
MKVFFDSNVLIAAFLEEHEHHGRALPVVARVHEGKDAGFASAHTVLELYATLTRLPRSPRLLPQQAAAMIEENVVGHFELISLTAREYGALVLRLGRQGVAGGISYDALHMACARKCKADRVYSFNARHFQAVADSEIANRIVSP